MHHTVAISDIHLSEVEPGTGLWMRYRQKDVTPGPEIAQMLGELLERVRGDELTLVLNGDVFDFDAPRVLNGASVFHNLPRNAEESVPAAAAILCDHPEFVRGLAGIVAAGHTVIFVSGNHDAQLTLSEVRAVVRAAIAEHACELPGGSMTAEELARRVQFRAWFYRTEDGIVFEHGHQYDSFCAFRYPMAPFGRRPGLIQPTLGSLTARLYMGRLGYFNPHVDTSFMLSLGGYLRHWTRYYLFTRRFQSWIWFSGGLRALYELARHKEPGSRERRARNLEAAAAETGVSLRSVARHARLFAMLGEQRLWMCARELWLDRVLLGGLAFACILAWILSEHHAFGLLATLGPAVMVAVELSVPKSTLQQHWEKVQRRARQVARVHKARGVVFGHTHMPEGVWENGVFFGNTGSWSAAYRDVACKEPLYDQRPFIWLTSEGGAVTGGLCAWKPGELRRISNENGGFR
jgi:UDP-2,3-diacylglucosamine pyrophosphatase LpxH